MPTELMTDGVPDADCSEPPPLILHFDVNKTVIIADSIMNKSTEYTIREVIANQVWGTIEYKTEEGSGESRPIWKWDGRGPSLESEAETDRPINYLWFVRNTVEDKSAIRLATRSFELVNLPECRQMMSEFADQAVRSMTIPVGQRTKELEDGTGLVGEWRLIFPSFFKFIAHLHKQKRHFAILFRSFGTDLDRLRTEWNAFCEKRHPLYMDCMEGLDPMDGSVPGVPDRRLGENDIHTMYRDAKGPLLALDIMTNGNWEGEWDSWARSGAKTDTRGGRLFLQEAGTTVKDGYNEIQQWMVDQLNQSKSTILREDFAWWYHSGESPTAGKLLIGIDGVQQVFFDDNIGVDDFRIVDPRSSCTFMPLDVESCLGKAVFRVNPMGAILNSDYFIEQFSQPSVSQDVLWHEEDGIAINRRLSVMSSSVLSTNNFMHKTNSLNTNKSDPYEDGSVVEDTLEILTITDAESLYHLLSSEGVEVAKFGAPGTSYKSIENLNHELIEGKCCLKRAKEFRGEGEVRVLREMEVVRVKLMCNNLILMETHEQLPDGRLRSRNGYLPASKKRQGESLEQTLKRWAAEELQLTLSDDQMRQALGSCLHNYVTTPETMSYPLPCSTHYIEVCCCLQHEKLSQVLLDRLGLPAGTMFSTRGRKKMRAGKDAASTMRFWSWYRSEVYEAITLNEEVELPDVQQVLEDLFQGHARRNAYESLLLQMFDSFTASKLCGGLSGSLVLHVQPVDFFEGKNAEPVIVKLDKADVISREIVNSKRVWNALQDRAARILGQGCFFTDTSSVEYGAFKIELAGGCWQVPELTQGSRSKDLLRTFKDLFTVESERQLLNTDMHHLISTCGDVELVLLELLGPGGMLRVLRREGLGRSPRSLFHSFNYMGKPTKWNPFHQGGNFQTPPIEALWKRTFGRAGNQDLPNVQDQVDALVARIETLEQTPLGSYRPLIGLAHGDLNAMNILIDVMDAVWIIDFAFSEEKPLCWDLAKLEIAFMFEYAVLPVSWQTLLEFAGEDEAEWRSRKVHTWLGVSEAVTIQLLRELTTLKALPDLGLAAGMFESRPNGRRGSFPGVGVATGLPRRWSAPADSKEYTALAHAIKRACDGVYKDPADRSTQRKRDTELCRICALLLANQDEEAEVHAHAAAVTDNMLSGGDLSSVMEPPPLESSSMVGASLSFCRSKAAKLRLFFKEEWLELRRRVEHEVGPVLDADESPLVFWLGLLQESYRLLGYFDVAPWVKCWSINYIEQLVLRINKQLDKAHAATTVRKPMAGCSRSTLVLRQMMLPREYPSDAQIASRVHGQAGSKPSPLGGRARIRSAHVKTPAVANMGGLFGEIRAIQSVTIKNQMLRAELVRAPGSLTNGHTPKGSEPLSNLAEVVNDSEHEEVTSGDFPLEFGGVQIGMISVFFGAATVNLSLPIVPLGTKAWSQQERRRGIHAHGAAPNSNDITVVFSVADTAYCYPPGARLRLAPDNIAPIHSGLKLRYAKVRGFNGGSGNYSVIIDNMMANSFDDTEADPIAGNHLTAHAYRYSEGTQLMALCRERGSFVDAVVAKAPRKDTLHKLRSEAKDGKGEAQEWDMDLNDFNHARRTERMSAEVYDEEVRRYRVYVKAKHSLIYTVTSERADVLEGPVPRTADEAGRDVFFWSEVQALISEDDERMTTHLFFQGILIVGEPGSGKSCLLCKLVMHCLSHSTMLLPLFIPVIDLCSRLQKADKQDIFFASEADAAEDDLYTNDAEGLVDWYLRMVYGDDTNRFFMLRQALDCHRLVLLFDGLEDAGSLIGRMDRCITGLVALNHRVVATVRLQVDPMTEEIRSPTMARKKSHLSASMSWMQTPELFRVLELLPLEMECRRSLVEALFGHEKDITSEEIDKATDFVEDFIMNLEDDEGRKWSTPMMVSMLVASWREKKRQEQKRKYKVRSRSTTSTIMLGGVPKANDISPMQRGTPTMDFGSPRGSPTAAGSKFTSAGGDAREVYRVALDLLLRRFQSRQQADRHKLNSNVQKFKELLELIAVKMTDEATQEFTDADVPQLLEDYGIDLQVWVDLAGAISEGRVPLLQRRGGGTSTRYLFTYKSFQQYLSGSATARLSTKRMNSLVVSPTVSSLSACPQLSTPAGAGGLGRISERTAELSPRRGPPAPAELMSSRGVWCILADLLCCSSSRSAGTPRLMATPRHRRVTRVSSSVPASSHTHPAASSPAAGKPQ